MDLHVDTPLPPPYYNARFLTLECHGPLEPHELHALGRLFVRHNVHGRLGLTLVHRHFLVPRDHVMLRTRSGCRAVPHAFPDNSCGGRHSTASNVSSGYVALPPGDDDANTYGAAWTLVRNRENRQYEDWRWAAYELGTTHDDDGAGPSGSGSGSDDDGSDLDGDGSDLDGSSDNGGGGNSSGGNGGNAGDSAAAAAAVTACPEACMRELRAYSYNHYACGRYGVAVLDPARRRILEHPNPATGRMQYRPLAGERVPLRRGWPTEYRFRVAHGGRIVPVGTRVCLHYTEWMDAPVERNTY